MQLKKLIRFIMREVRAFFLRVAALFFTRGKFNFYEGMAIKFFGTHYGGGWVCISFLNKNSLVYSIGVGNDISFDESLFTSIGCRILGFDPTPKAIQYIESHPNLPGKYKFYPIGLSHESGTEKFYFPANPDFVSMSLTHDSDAGFCYCNFLSIDDLMSQLNHDYVDLCKIDIEGTEYQLFDSWITQHKELNIGQLWVEFHPKRAMINLNTTLTLINKTKAIGLIPFWDGNFINPGVLFINSKYHKLQPNSKYIIKPVTAFLFKQGLLPL